MRSIQALGLPSYAWVEPLSGGTRQQMEANGAKERAPFACVSAGSFQLTS